MQPFKLIPAYKDYLWGGTKLKEQFNKQSPLKIVAESWELSAHPDGPSVIANGPLTGTDFGTFVQTHPEEWSAEAAADTPFPILVKFIDAAQSLSIQVHPNDEYAWRVEGEPGKTEVWIILDAEEDAFLYLGFEREISKEEFRQHIQQNTLLEVLHKHPVKKGDVVFIPAGTVHAIGAGILLAEVQQSSNSTYRVYDFGRVGADGKTRPLHIEKAVDVSVLKPASTQVPGAQLLQDMDGCKIKRLVGCPYFTIDEITLSGTTALSVNGEFVALLCLQGSAVLASQTGDTISVNLGETVFIPAKEAKTLTLTGDAVLLKIFAKE